MPLTTEEMLTLKADIESFDRTDQSRALKILLDGDIPHDENANGVFVNMSNIPVSTLDELASYVGYVKLQQTFLLTQEQEKEELRHTYFKASDVQEAC